MKEQSIITILLVQVFLLFSTQVTATDSDVYYYTKPNQNLKNNKDLSDFVVEYLGDSSNVSILNFEGNFDREIDGQLNIEARQAVLQEFYNYQADNFDFLVFFTKFTVDSGDAAAFNISYMNDVEGIGIPLYDNSLDMGSERLQATIDMTELSDWELNPSNSQFNYTMGVLLHEMMHRWGIKVRFKDENGAINNLTLGRDGSHWNYFLNSNASVMYGSLWSHLGNDLFRTTAVMKSLSPLDLYLMGFRTSGSVPDFFLIDNGAPGDKTDIPPLVGTEANGNRLDISINDVIAAEGERIPSAQNAQHKFNFRFILLKHASQQLSSKDIGRLVTLQREFQKRFFVETNGLGEILYSSSEQSNTNGTPSGLVYEPANRAYIDLTEAETFIINNQLSPQGNWYDKESTKVRDTVLAIKLLQLYEHSEAVEQAIEWLNGFQASNNDELAWQLYSGALTSNKKEEVVNQLVENINDDGGWGLRSDSESSVYDTALVLRSLIKSGTSIYTPSSQTRLYVENHINTDFGVGYVSGGFSSLTSSVLLLDVMSQLEWNQELIINTANYIINQQLPNGGFGADVASVHETAQVIDVFKRLDDQNYAQDINAAITQLTKMQSIDGTFEGSIFSTALASMVLLNDTRPNLELVNTTIQNSTPVLGEIVTLNFDVRLDSTQNMENIEVGIFDINSQVSSMIIPVVEPDKPLDLYLDLDTSNFSLGVTDLVIAVDAQNAVVETNEYDNAVNFSLEVVEQNNTPEFTYISSSINYLPAFINNLPLPFELTFEVINLSSSSVQGVEIALYKRIDGGSLQKVLSQSHDIGSNQPVVVTFNDTLVDGFSEAFEYVVIIDPDNQVPEVNELNNQFVINLTQDLTLDFDILSENIVSPSAVYVGQMASFSYAVSNTGTVISPAYEVAISINDGNTTEQISIETMGSIAPGELVEFDFEHQFNQIGIHEIQIVIDPENTISEADETNNLGILTLDVQGNNLANLKVQGSDIQPGSDPGLEGQAGLFSVLVSNTSTIPSGPFDITLLAQKINEPPFEVVALESQPSIPGGSSQLIDIEVAEVDFSGNVLIIATVDPNQLLDEFDESDNTTFIEYQVLAKSDAHVSSGGFSLSPKLPVIGEALTVEVNVSNSGEQEITAISASLYTVNSSTQDEVLVGSDSLSSLTAGESSFFTFNFTFPDDVGIDQLKVVVDESNLIDEGREDNNIAVIEISQQDNDFYLNNKYFSPNGDGQKDSVQIVFNLDQTDNYQITIRNELGQLVRRFDYSQFSQTSYGDLHWDGRGGDGTILPDGQYTAHIIGENTSYENDLDLWIDTNRSSLATTLKHDAGVLFDLNCLTNEINDSGIFSFDGKHLYVISYQDKSAQQKYGVYRIKADGSEIKALLPDSFTVINRVRELYQYNDGRLIFRSTNPSNDSELWILNPDSMVLKQLSTVGIDDFGVFDFSDGNLVIQHYDNSQYNFNRISLNPLEQPEPIVFQPNVNNYNDLNRVSDGWIWFLWNSINYDVYFKSDVNSSSILLGTVDNKSDVKISSDKNFVILAMEHKIDLFRIDHGISAAINIVNSNQSLNSDAVQFLRNNHVLWVGDTINLFDEFGVRILQVNHPFNNDYFVEQIIQKYGSTDNLTYFSEWGDLNYSLDDLENLQVNITQLRFALGGEHELFLSFSAELTGHLYIENGDVYESVFFQNNGNDANKRINYSNFSDIDVLDLSNTNINSPSFSERISNYFNMGSDILVKNAAAEPVPDESSFLSDYYWLNYNNKVHSSTIINQLFVMNDNSNYANTCTPVFGKERAIFQSKYNLTTFITADVFDNGVEITGSVFDQFLAQYFIEWKRNDQATSHWNFIMSGQNNQINELFNYWIPPEPGVYTLRLSAYDQAGNISYDEVELVVGSINANIQNLEVSPRYISPNSDGVQDVLNISYDLIKPVNVIVEIKTESDYVIKRIVRNYVPGMVNDQFSWDGTDDNNQIVNDNQYFVVIEGMSFPVTVDIEQPKIELQVAQYLTKTCCFDSSINAQVKLKPSLDGKVNETAELMTQVEQFDELTGVWRTTSERININPFNYAELHNLLLRGLAIDKAGNQSFTEEVSVETNKAVPIDIKRIVEKDGKTNIYQAPLRESGSGVMNVGIYDYPEITNPQLSNHLGITIQAKSFQSIESIEMKTTYRESVEDQEVDIVNTVPLELSDLALAKTYFRNDTLNEVAAVPNLFRLSNQEGEYYLYFVQIDQDMFPNTSRKIRVELIINYHDDVISHPFDIAFTPINGGLLNYFIKATSHPAYSNSLLAPQAYKHMERVMFGNDESEDLWYFSELHTVANDPKMFVFEQVGFGYKQIDEIELHYEEKSSEYISQYFKWKFDNNCEDLKNLMFVYIAIDEDGNDFTVEYKPDIPCAQRATYSIWFDANAYCDNNAPIDQKLKVVVNEMTLPDSVIKFPPHTYQVVLEDSTGIDYLLYEEENPVLIDGIKYSTDIEINKTDFNGGLYKLKNIFYNTVQTDLGNIIKYEHVFKAYVEIENSKGISEISQPIPSQKLCAVDTENGRFVPVSFVSTLATGSPYLHSFTQITNGAYQDVTPNNLNAQNSVEYETENNFKQLRVRGVDVSENLQLFADPEVETTTLLHEVINSTGVSYCSEVELEVDSKLEAEFNIYENQFVNEKLLLSPDNDGDNDLVTFGAINSGEDISVRVELYRKNTHDFVGLISNHDLVLDDLLTFSWDGLLNGVAVEDGSYYIKVTYHDSCLLTATHNFDVIVDTTEPVVSFISPTNEGEVGFITDVETSVIEENLDTVSVAFLYNGVWNPITTDSQLINLSGEYAVTGNLNLMGLPQGTYSLRLLAQDLLGYTAEAIIDVTLPLEQNIFWQYQHSPQYISPNTDGVQDQVLLSLGLNIQSDLIIDIQDHDSSTVNILDSGSSYPSGTHQLTWDGRDANGQVVPNGFYSIRTQAAEVGQPLNNETMTAHFIVDNTLPFISYSIQDAAVVKGEGAVALTLVEPNLKTLSVYEQSIEPVGTENLLFSDLQTGTFDVLLLSEMSEQTLQIRTTAKDKAGNVTDSIVGFEIDNTAPIISLDLPKNMDFVGNENDSIIFSGEITEKNFSTLQIFISPEVEPAQWQPIHSGNTLVNNQFNLEWPISVPDGRYLIRILATDLAGWETETIIAIIIDRVPPQVEITQPLAGSLNGNNLLLKGTVDDSNLSFYHLSYHIGTNQTSDQWQIIHTGIEPVIDDMLHDWNHELESGTYLLRLFAQDEAGLSSATIVEVNFDTESPLTPLYLEAQLVNQLDVQLSWQASQSEDVIGYRIYRNNQLLNDSLITTTNYQDLAVAEGEFTYQVVAIDTLGNVSVPSNAVTLNVDRTGPETNILIPINNQVVSGVLDVVGTASSEEDFLKYELFYREQNDPLPGALIGQSALPVIGQIMAGLDTNQLLDGETYVIRLEALDITKNLEFSERSFVVDNSAPDAPINLTYQLIGANDVQLNWNANVETDLVGYLVYRNGVIISGNGTVASSLITTTSYQDNDVVDGLHTYYVVAVDAALNVSVSSNSVEVDINTRVPDAYFTAPIDGYEFESPIRLEAASEDADIASMLFEYSVDGNTWNTVRYDVDEPFYALFNPIDFGVSFGDIAFRVTATDTNTMVDPSPDEINVTYKDLTPPGPVVGLVGMVAGDEIQLNWTANIEPDLAGYVVSRKRLHPNPEDSFTQLTSPFEVDSSYLDDSLADGVYIYRVSAIDHNENQSIWTYSVELTIFSIVLDQPYSPLLVPATINITGQSDYQGEVSAGLTNESGSLIPNPVHVDTSGNFVFESVLLDTGDNEFTTKQTTIKGHVSKDSSINVQVSPTPLMPINPQATANGFNLEFTWESPDAETIGYVPYINSQPYQLPTQLIESLYPSASSNSYAVNRVLDGNENTYWSASYDDRTNGFPVYFQVSFQSAQWLTKVDINWAEYSNSDAYQPNKYMLQYLSPVGWITQADFSGIESASVSFESNEPYLTEAIRIWMPMNEVDNTYIELSEVEIFHQPFVTNHDYQADLSDGNYDLQVSAINSYGFESELTTVQSLVVGDVVPPEAVTLQASVENGNQVDLQWSISSSNDIVYYRVFRNNKLIYTTADANTLTYSDVDLPNGVYHYYVVAVDTADNLSANSNEVGVEISQQLLSPPTGLMIGVVESGNALILDWNQYPDPRFSYFVLYRSLSADTGFEAITQTSSTNFVDANLVNGTRYYYYVTAIDSPGNESLPSNVVTGVPFDSVAPDQPVITDPTTSGNPITINSVITDVSGFGSPAVEVELYVNDEWVSTVTSSSNYALSELAFNHYLDEIKYNSIYSTFAGYDFNSDSIVIVDVVNDTFIPIDDSDLYNYSWSADGTKLYGVSGYGSQSNFKSFNLNGEESAVMYSGFEIAQYSVSIDETILFYQGEGVNPDTSITEYGLWLYSFAGGTYKKLLFNESINIRDGSVVWLADGNLAFINFPNGTYSEGELWHYDLNTEQLSLLEAKTASDSDLSSSKDGSHLYYVVDTDENNSITRLRLSDNQKTNFARAGINVTMPAVNQDIDLVMVNIDCCEKELINIATGETIDRFENIGYQIRVTWLVDGRIMFVDSDRIYFIEPPGRFDFIGVELSPGLNELLAVARKGNDLVSVPSESIEVTLNKSALSDLEIRESYLQISPSQVYQEQSLTGTVLVKNASQVDVEESRLLIEVIDPSFVTQLIEPAPLDFSLAADEVLAVNFSINNLNALGEYTIRVFADSNQQVFETNENNNSVFKVFQVIDDQNADLEVLINDNELAPGDELSGLLRVYNPGAEFNGSVTVRIVDEQGYAVGFEESFQINALGSQRTWQQAIKWGSEDSFAGSYFIESTLFNQWQQNIGKVVESFSVGVVAEYALSLSSYTTQASANENIKLHAEVDYMFGNSNQTGTFHWQVFNEQQQLIWSDYSTTTTMSPGFNGVFEKVWPGNQPGSYQAKVVLITETADLSATVPIEVMAVDSKLNLSGRIHDIPAGIILGQTWDSNYSLQNNGQVDLVNVPVSISIWDSQLTESLGEQMTSVSLSAGETTQLFNAWNSDGLILGNYVLVLHADMSSQGLSSNYLLDTQVVDTADAISPKIVIFTPVDQGIYLPNLELRTSVSDLYSEVESVDIYIDSALQASLPSQALNDLYLFRLSGLSDGLHLLNVEASDAVGNVSNQSLSFTVDGTFPVIEISGVAEGGLYNSAVQALVNITDTNLSESQIILDGVPYISGDSIVLEGSHILMVSATDAAGNTATKRVTFNVDLTPPEVIISYPENNSETNQDHTILVGSSEVGAEIVLNVDGFVNTVTSDFEGSFKFTDVPLSFGQNIITVQATDLAGNVGQSNSIVVSYVNAVTVSGFLTAQSNYGLGEMINVSWQISNLNDYIVDQLPVELNLYSTKNNQLLLSDVQTISINALETVEFDSIFDSETLSMGDHRIELRVEINQIWQVLDVDLILLQDVTGPEISVVEPIADQISSALVNILVIANDEHSEVAEVSYTIGADNIWFPMIFNGSAYEAQQNLSDGLYQITFKAKDIFNNETLSPPTQFTVDATAPVINITSPINGLRSNQPVLIDFQVTDDNDFTVDAQLNQISMTNGFTVTDEGAYELVIIATDEVGNQADLISNFVLDFTVPVVEVTSPEQGSQSFSGLVDIIGSAEERNIITIKINGIESTIKTDALGNFAVINQILEVGNNLIEITATDQAGNTSVPIVLEVEYIQTGSVKGRVWQDDNQDADFGVNELGFNQISMRLTDSAQVDQEILTDSNGEYVFPNLSPGTYTIEVIEAVILNEWNNTTDNNPTIIDIVVDKNTVVNFGFYQEKASIETNALANDIKGRLLVLVDPSTAEIDNSQCLGVAEYQLQKFVDAEFISGNSVWAKLYDDQGNLLQTETASYSDFEANGYQFIDFQPETTEFNLILHPVINRHLKATVTTSSTLNPVILQASYRLVLGMAQNGQSHEWSSGLIVPGCQIFASIGSWSDDLRFVNVHLNPPLPSDDPNGSLNAPHLIKQQVMLENLLLNAGWSYRITTDADEFEAELLTGEYVAYWLMAENKTLSGSAQNNLMLAVEAGAGLLVSSGRDNLSTDFYSSMGVDVLGAHLNATELQLLDSEITSSEDLTIEFDEQVLKVSITDGISAGLFNGVGINEPYNQAVILNEGQYGLSVFAGMDWLLQATEVFGINQYAELIQSVLDYIHPLGLANELGYARSIKLNLQNTGRPVDGYVDVLLPLTVDLVHSDIPVTVTQDGFTFEYDLAEGELLEFEFWLKVDFTPETISFDIHIGEDPNVYEEIDLILIAGERPDLSVSLTNCQAGIKYGQDLYYIYEISNIGNKDIFGASAYIEFDPGLHNPSWTCAGYSGGVCDQSNGTGGLTGQNIDLPVGASINYIFNTTVSNQSVDDVVVSGYVMMPDNVSDISPSDNSGEDFDQVYPFIFKNGFDCATAGSDNRGYLNATILKEVQ